LLGLYIGGSTVPVRKVSGGIITTLGPPADALAVDNSGNLFMAQGGGCRIVELSASGELAVVAGGSSGYSGDGGQATSASLSNPTGIAVDAAGNLYVSDQGNNRIRKVSGGIITTIAGNGVAGFTGDGGFAISANLDHPFGVAVDSAGTLYIADGVVVDLGTAFIQNIGNRIRKVSGGIIDIAAGNGRAIYSGDDGPATGAQLTAWGVALDASGNTYITDSSNHRIREVSGGIITTVAGNGTSGFSGDGSSATSAQLSHPSAAGADASGNIYIADYGNDRIRKVSGGVISTVLSTGAPQNLAVDAAGNVYFVDGNNNILKLSGSTVTTLGHFDDLPSANPPYLRQHVPAGIAVDTLGNIFVADGTNGLIRELSGGILTTVGSAQVGYPDGIAVDAAGNLYISEEANIQKVTGSSATNIAGDGTAGFAGDGGAAILAEFRSPWGVAVDTSGNVYIADSGNERIRRLTPTSEIAINITTTFPGLAITVDGGSYTAPHLFTWTAGETHTIGVSSPQLIGNNSRYIFANWSDGLAATHIITVASSAATYTAAFNAQYLLVAVALPSRSGSVIANPTSPDGYYTSGTSVQLTASPSAGALFANWSGDLSGTANAEPINMNAPHTVTANFTSVPAQPVGSQPASGGGNTQNFTFQFSHPSGWQNLAIVNVLINKSLDGRGACYLAYVVPSTALVLVDDAGDAGGPFAGSVVLGSSNTLQNGQCTVSLVSATGNGTTLTLGLNVTFKAVFGGNKVIYLAATDEAQNNSNWQALGVWQVPFASSGPIAVGAPVPARTAGPSGTPQTLALTLTDSKGVGDIGIVNVLINSAIDGRQACYLAYVAASNTLFLVDDAGDAGGPFAGGIVLNGGGGTIQNSQCAVSGVGSSALSAGNSLTLTLSVTFRGSFTGHWILYVAGRDVVGANNTDWQAMGTWTVQ